jgi:hypothetical protein
VKRYYVKNQVILEWFGNEFYKTMSDDSALAERATAERVYRKAIANAPVGNYRRSYRKFYTSKTGKIMKMKPWQQRMPGRLRGSIKKYISKFKEGGWIVMAGDFLAYYARIVEYGTKQRRQKTTGRFTGSQRKGRRYMKDSIKFERRYLMSALRKLYRARQASA